MRPFPPIQHNQNQSGFLLESLGLVLLILSLLALLQMNKKLDEDLDSEAIRRGQALATIRNYANDYLISYSTKLLELEDMWHPMAVTTGAGNVVEIKEGGYPTIEHLKALGKAPPNQPRTAIGGGEYRIKIEKKPDGCIGQPCNLEGIVYIERDSETIPDYARLGISAGVVGSDGAFSSFNNPQIISGFGGWNVPNPSSPQPGILAARFGYSSSIFSEYYKRDGSTPLTGDMPAAGHAIINAGDITAKDIKVNNIDAKKIELPAGDNIKVGNSIYYGDGTESAIRQSGGVHIQNQDGSAAADIRQVANITSSGTVQTTLLKASNVNSSGTVTTNLLEITGEALRGAPCNTKGTMAQDGTGAPLFCVSSHWQGGAGNKFTRTTIDLRPENYSVDLSLLLPADVRESLTGIQITTTVAMRSDPVGPRVSLLVDGMEMMAIGFDTATGNEYIRQTSSFIIPPGRHSFAWRYLYVNRVEEIKMYISGYW